MNFKSKENPYDQNPVIHMQSQAEEEKDDRKQQINSLKLDLKINAADFRVIRNLDMIKSATLPNKGIDYLSKSMNFNSPAKDEIEEISSPKKSIMDKSVNSCLICFDKIPDAVFMDCGHGGFLTYMI